jgi:O-antigen/teichoic acid export membrane protein
MIGTFGEVAVSVFKGFGQPYRITFLEVIQSSITVCFVWVLTRRFGLVGSAMAWLPAVLFSQLLSVYFLKNLLDHPLQGLKNPLLAILAATSLCFVVAMTANYLIPGVVGLITASILGGVSTIWLLWAADRRYKLGFADNLALAFPQFVSFLRLNPSRPE